MRQYDSGKHDDLAYRLARRNAHNAVAALSTTLSNMLLEPGHFRKDAETGFRFLILSHTLLNYLSGLGAHRESLPDDASDALLERGLASGKRIPKDNAIQRYKGLGEMNYNELWDTTMNPDTRTLRQVQMSDAEVADEVFATLMGEDVESRRAFIQRNAHDVRFLDI